MTINYEKLPHLPLITHVSLLYDVVHYSRKVDLSKGMKLWFEERWNMRSNSGKGSTFLRQSRNRTSFWGAETLCIFKRFVTHVFLFWRKCGIIWPLQICVYLWRIPEAYCDQKLPTKVPPLCQPVPLTSLPTLGYLEQVRPKLKHIMWYMCLAPL